MANKDTKYTIEVELKGDSKQVQQAIKDGLSKDFNAKIGADTSKLSRDINTAIKELNSSDKKVKIGIDGSNIVKDINNALKSIESDSLKKVKLGADTSNLLRDINKAITTINSSDSLKKLKLGVDINYLQQQLNKAVRGLDTAVKLQTKLETTSRTSETKGTVTTNKTSKEEAQEYQSLFSKRAASIANLDRAYQEFGRNSKEVSAAIREFVSASKDVRKFGRDTGVLSLNKVKSDIERQLGAGLTTDFTKNWLRMEYDKVLKDIDNLDRQLKPEKYEKIRAKEEYQRLDAEHKDLAAQLKAVADAYKAEAAEVRRRTQELKFSSDVAKGVSKGTLKALADSAKLDKGLDSNKMDKFMEELQNYRNLTGNYRSSYFYNLGRELGITEGHPYFPAMQKLYQSNLDLEAKWRQKPITANVDVKGSEKVEELNQKVLTTTQQFMRLRGEALKAGNALNQATNPKDVERLRAEFQKAIQALVNYQRATRGLTKGGEAQLVEKLAVGNIKEQTEAYKVLVEWIKKAVQAQRDLDVTTGRKLPRRSKDTDFMSYLNNMDWGRAVSGMAYAARGELNTVQALGNFISSMSQLSGVVGSFAKFLGGLGVAVLAFTGVVNAAATAFSSLINVLSQVGRAVYDALKPGIELYKLRETAELSLAATLSNMATEEGRNISYERGLELSAGLVNRAFMDALKSAFNPEELIRAMQGTLGIAFAKGLNLDQAYNVVKSTAAVAKSIQLQPNQLLQEVRDILQGTLTAKSSQVAYAVGMNPESLREAQSVGAKIGLTDEGIQQAQEQGRLYEYIMEKMQTYNIALEKYADTFSGAMDRLTESWALAGMKIFEQIAPGLNGLIDNIINDFILTIDENNMPQLSDNLKQVGEALSDIVAHLMSVIDAVIEFVKDLTGQEDTIGAIKALIIDMIDIAAFGFLYVLQCAEWLKEAAIGLYNIVQRISNLSGVLDAGVVFIEEFTAALVKLITLDFKGFIDKVESAQDRAAKNIQERWNEGIIDSTNISGRRGLGLFEQYRGKNRLAYEEGKLRYGDRTPKPYDATKIEAKAMADAAKQSLAEQRKMIQAMIEDIKQALKQALQELKDIAEQNELAYRQGYKSIEDYFSQKAEIEEKEALLKLEAAIAERDAIASLNTGGDAGAEYQQQRDLIKYESDIATYTREYNKKASQSNELLGAIQRTLENKTYQTGIVANARPSTSISNISNIPNGIYYDVADADIEGLTDLTLQKLNAVAYEYLQAFGERIMVTSAKREGDGSSWHDSGQAFDIAMDSLYDKSRRLWLEEIAEKYALVPLDEYPGEPGAIYAHGDNFHFSDRGDPLDVLLETVEQEVQQATNQIEGRMPQAFSTLVEAYQSMVKQGQKQMLDAQKEYAKTLNDPALLETISLSEVEAEMTEKIAVARDKFASIPAIADNLEKLFPIKKLEAIVNAQVSSAETRLKIMEHDAMAMNRYLREKTTLFPKAIADYASYFFSADSPYSITAQLNKMIDSANKYAAGGQIGKFHEVMSKVEELQNKFISMVESWISEMNEYFNYRRQLVEADSGLTSFVKEERTNQLNKGEARVKAVAYAEEARALGEQRIYWQEKLNEAIAIGNVAEGQSAQYQMQYFEKQQQIAMRQAEINAKLGEQKTLWQETMDAANQALENGLYNFMTDYINTAESIGEAFRNMAIDILKDLQKFFAKKAITDLMHVIVGEPNPQYNAPNYAETQIASNTYSMVGWLQAIYTAIGNLQAAQSAQVFSNLGGSVVGNTYIPNARPSSIPGAGQKRATGGYISGPGTSTSDSIHAMLSNGEYVIKADAVRKYGLNFLDAVNSGHFTRMRTVIPRFADGGYVGDALQDTARGMTDFAKNLGTSVGVDNTISIALVRDEQEAIREWSKSPSGGQKFLVDFAKGNGRVFSRFNR